MKMVSLRNSVSQRAKRIWLAGLCAASLATGQLLADEPVATDSPAAPQTIINEYLQARDGAVTKSHEPSVSTQESKPIGDSSKSSASAPPAKEVPLVPARPLPTNAANS